MCEVTCLIPSTKETKEETEKKLSYYLIAIVLNKIFSNSVQEYGKRNT
jgi:hypothetical protein